MNSALEILARKIESLLNSDAQITKKDKTVSLVFPNPSGGFPLHLEFFPGEDLKLSLRKTSRYYQQESSALNRLLRDVEKYVTCQIVLLDYTTRQGEETLFDRMVNASDVEVTTLDELIDLCIHCNLIHSDALTNILTAGGTLNVHFWNSHKDYCYKLKGSELVKESGTKK